jgi:hypothetical protein
MLLLEFNFRSRSCMSRTSVVERGCLTRHTTHDTPGLRVGETHCVSRNGSQGGVTSKAASFGIDGMVWVRLVMEAELDSRSTSSGEKE